MECNNKHCLWSTFGQCCHEDETKYSSAKPNELDCPSSLRVDFEDQLFTLADECKSLMNYRTMKELIEVKAFIESQRK